MSVSIDIVDNLFIGMTSQTKQCGICNKQLPLGCFGFDGGSNYRRYECKDCAKQQAQLTKNLKKKYLGPNKDYECPGCKLTKEQLIQRQKGKLKKGVWCIDHDHSTGEFRGYLCHKCNLTLGNANDNPEVLERLASYVRQYEKV